VEGRFGIPAWGQAAAKGLAPLRVFAISRARATKRGLVMSVDASLCAVACYLSVLLRLGSQPPLDTPFPLMIGISIALALPLFRAFGLYREVFSQTGVHAIVAIGRASAAYTLPFATVIAFVGLQGVPRTVSLIQPVLLFAAVVASRVFARHWLNVLSSAPPSTMRRVLIYGAGSAGRQLAGAIAPSLDMEVVGFIDDSQALIGSVIDGRRIHAPSDLPRTVQRFRAHEILLAIPSASLDRRKAIIAEARKAGVRIRTLPDLMDIAHGRIGIAQLRDVQIEDLLGRAAVAPDVELMRRHIRGKTAMITGAGGSIGGELCRRMLALEPEALLLVDINEFSLYEIDRELAARDLTRKVRVIPLLGSINDANRMDEIIGAWRPDTIFHAAAYKHVPLVERNPAEGVHTNVLGVYTLGSVAARWRTPNFVFVSTDKAVRPTNVMGATKRAAELVLQALNAATPATRFSMVRFGNVLGSSGSVVPLFRQQILAGGPITLTDRRITRYFMTGPEAAELVLQAAAMANGGEVFLLDMGQPVRIADLARNMIELAGLVAKTPETPAGDIEIVEVGLRPGEKLYEELLIGDATSGTDHPRIWRADEAFIPLDALRPKLERLAGLLGADQRSELIAALKELVPEFEPQAGVSDWVQIESLAAPGAKVA
jgi:FlaA1/EpsC-like NDP-sugar epimerase